MEKFSVFNFQLDKTVNTFGNIYRLTSFGESHGPGIGGVSTDAQPGSN